MLNKFCRASIPNVLGHGNFSSCCGDLKSMVKRRIQYEQDRVKKLKKTHGNCKVGDVTVNMVFGGLRGMKGLVCETSSVDPNAGITFRGKSIEDCQNLLPRAPGCSQPLPEGLFFLMLTGTVPNQEQVKSVSVEWAIRSQIPDHIVKLLDTFPTSMHPMTQLSSAMTALNTESQFAKRYGTLKKSEHWEVIYEDCMDVIAKVPVIAATIYRNTYKRGVPVVCGEIDVDRDWACNFCRMLGYSDPAFIELMRLYICIHCDHEGGNVSVHTARVVGSALSDPYLSYAAGMNGLAGPLHGLANQEVLEWLKQLQKELGKNYTEQTLKDFITKTLKSGKVVPGYGHAVLRKTDPRYNCLKNFAQTHLPKDPMVKLVADVNKVVPPILESLGKVQNPWANVDAHSGVVLYPYMKETSYYTVLFGVARTLGIMANIIWDRGLGLPIERPSSKNIDGYIKLLGIDTRCDSG